MESKDFTKDFATVRNGTDLDGSIIKGLHQSDGFPVNGLSVFASSRDEMLSILRDEFDAYLNEKGETLCHSIRVDEKGEPLCRDGKCICTGNNLVLPSGNRSVVPTKEEMEAYSQGRLQLLRSAGLFTFWRKTKHAKSDQFMKQQAYLCYT